MRGALGVRAFDVGVVCVDNRKIQQMNGIYREQQDTPTDVLSFLSRVSCPPVLVGLPSAVIPLRCHRPGLSVLLGKFQIHTKVEGKM